ncbi:MAG TPA: hypothetical protein VFA26_19245 [Gemmataceae bacterium]|nr:hypothetical protein [Gemmataceae bacterium]
MATVKPAVARPRGPDLRDLWSLFPPADDIPAFEIIPAHAVPSPYHALLVHEHHMTVTQEKHHGCPVAVRVLAVAHQGDYYARKILLTRESDGRVVQFGIPRIDLRCCSPAVRAALLEQKTPLGRILIQHKVLRRIEPTAYLRVVPSPAMMGWFGLTVPTPTYGRLAYIHCDGRPAIELLEIAAPE